MIELYETYTIKIQAIIYKGNRDEIYDFLGKNIIIEQWDPYDSRSLCITINNPVHYILFVKPEDYIIKYDTGIFGVCNPIDFNKKYHKISISKEFAKLGENVSNGFTDAVKEDQNEKR
jgi:hypothetical protein